MWIMVMIKKKDETLQHFAICPETKIKNFFIIVSTCKVDYLQESFPLATLTTTTMNTGVNNMCEVALSKFHSCMVRRALFRINFSNCASDKCDTYVRGSGRESGKIFLYKFCPLTPPHGQRPSIIEHEKGIFLQDNFSRKCRRRRRRLVPPEPRVFLPPLIFISRLFLSHISKALMTETARGGVWAAERRLKSPPTLILSWKWPSFLDCCVSLASSHMAKWKERQQHRMYGKCHFRGGEIW